jgi:ring-1,2-phenylacetyl-CoA epoxidase subunit PaaD
MTISKETVWEMLNSIPDPEVPAISIVELGVVRDVKVEGSSVIVDMTPTYTGCPAMKMMEEQVKAKLILEGLEVKINVVFKPAWTTDWMSDATKEKLRAYGIAPPDKLSFENLHPFAKSDKGPLKCPYCLSENTALTSQFGSTACKALYFCNGCHQPFEHFKCH